MSTEFLEHLMALCLIFSIVCALIAVAQYPWKRRATWNVKPVFLARPHSQFPKLIARVEHVKVRMMTP